MKNISSKVHTTTTVDPQSPHIHHATCQQITNCVWPAPAPAVRWAASVHQPGPPPGTGPCSSVRRIAPAASALAAARGASPPPAPACRWRRRPGGGAPDGTINTGHRQTMPVGNTHYLLRHIWLSCSRKKTLIFLHLSVFSCLFGTQVDDIRLSPQWMVGTYCCV